MLYPQSVTYAIEALLYLAEKSNDQYTKVKTIAEDLDIPEHFLGKIVTHLVRKQILVSSKGPTGGVTLKDSPKAINFYTILEAMDSTQILGEKCIVGLKECSKINKCPFHDDVERFKKTITKASKKISLEAFVKTRQSSK